MAETLQVRIEKLIYGGDGLARHDGQTVFVPFVLPAETVNIEPIERRKKFVRGRVMEVLDAAPQRVAPECPHFGVCGGCYYQHIDYQAQLRYKSEILRETLARIGKVSWEGPINTHASPPYGYRNRVQWKIEQGADGKPTMGYYEAGSHKLCAIRVCPILSPRLQETLAVFLRLIDSGQLPPEIREIEAFVDDKDEKLLLNLAVDLSAPLAGAKPEDNLQNFIDLLKSQIPYAESFLVHFMRGNRFQLDGPGYIEYGVGEDRYRVGHLSFFQVNRFLISEMVNLILENAEGKLALDLYAGVGLFSVPLARRFERLIAVESNAATARDLESNLQSSGAASPAAKQSDVTAFLTRWRDTPDFVLVDPPRAGVLPQALQRLSKLNPAVIGYLSCDPATLARDLVVLVGTRDKPGHYMLDSVHLVDIFPQSYHLEAFVRLIRRE